MSNLYKYNIGVLLSFLSISTSQGQGIVDGFFSGKGDISFTASYLRSSYDEFYVGENLTDPVPAHNEIDQNIYSLYAKYGLSDNFSIVANIPYISTKGNGEPDPINGEKEVSGFQDISILGKFRPYRIPLGEGNLDFITALGVNIPTGYEPNGVLSIGSGSFTLDPYLGFHLMADMGLFSTVSAGYSFRGDANNNLNIGDGGDFDVPNAFLVSGKVGYAASKFYLEAWVDYQESTDGVDIMGAGFAGNLPETEVNYTRLGLTGYVPINQLIGISGGYGTVVDGRNIGDSNYFYTGLTFNFDTGNAAVQTPETVR